MQMLDDDRYFCLNLCKSILKTDDGYKLINEYIEDKNGNIRWTPNEIVNRQKDCRRCLYSLSKDCLFRTKLENLPKNHYIPCHWTGGCDAYLPVYPLNIIKSEDDMMGFIEKVQNLFECIEDYEAYFGFNRRWDEETGEVLETVREYYDRGGEFKDIPNKYPCVIYFGLVDFDGERNNDEKLDWIYIGEGDER